MTYSTCLKFLIYINQWSFLLSATKPAGQIFLQLGVGYLSQVWHLAHEFHFGNGHHLEQLTPRFIKKSVWLLIRDKLLYILMICKTRKNSFKHGPQLKSHKGPFLEFMYLTIVSHSLKQLGTGRLVINKSSQNY